jgi:hypothetical protein
MVSKVLCHDGILIRDGMLGGSEGGLPYLVGSKSILYDGKKVDKPDKITIPEAMDYSCFKMIKHVYKLNNNFTTKLLQDHPDYDPAYKLWPMLKTIIHNVNAIMLQGSMDQCIDKTTFAAQGYAKKGSGIVHGISGKLCIMKGCQVVLSMDADHICPRAAVFHHPHNKKVNNCTKEGPNKMMLLWKCLNPLVKGQPEATGLNGKNQWQIFDGKTITCHNNHFSGKEMMAYAVEHGWGTISTLWQGSFSEGSSNKIFSQGMDKFGSTSKGIAVSAAHCCC